MRKLGLEDIFQLIIFTLFETHNGSGTAESYTYCLPQLKLGQAIVRCLTLNAVSHVGDRDLGIQAITCCLAQCELLGSWNCNFS